MSEEKEKIDYGAMSDEEYIAEAARLLAAWANLSTMPIVYGEGSSRTRKSISKSLAAFYDKTKHFFARKNLNRKRALAIGFRQFSKEAAKLLLVPLWYCGMIPEGDEVVTIDGTHVKYSKMLNHNVRFGVVAFGFEFEEAGAEARQPEGKGEAGQVEPGQQDKEGLIAEQETICPCAYGFIPQELECRLRKELDKKNQIGWLRKLWHAINGTYDCVTEGSLPCGYYTKHHRELCNELYTWRKRRGLDRFRPRWNARHVRWMEGHQPHR